MGVAIRSGRQPDAVCGSRRAVSRRGTVEGRRAGPGGDSGLRVRGRAAAGDRSCNLSSGYGFEQTVSSAWLNAGGYNSGPCIPPGSMSCMWYAIEGHDGNRSEEHTSELQSLMRISYAVFCWKKKNKNHKH